MSVPQTSKSGIIYGVSCFRTRKCHQLLVSVNSVTLANIREVVSLSRIGFDVRRSEEPKYYGPQFDSPISISISIFYLAVKHLHSGIFTSKLTILSGYDNPSRELTLPNEEARPFLDLFRQMLDYQVAQQDIQFPEDSEEIMKARVVELVGKAIAVYSALDGSTSINSTSTRSLQRTSTSGGSMQPIFSVTSDRTQRRSTMSSTSAPSSVVSMDSPEMIEGMNYSPTIFNVTSNPLGGSHGILVASPLPSSDLDDIVPPRDQGAPNRLDGVVHRVTADDSQTPGEDEGAA